MSSNRIPSSTNRILTSKYLKECKLFVGSMESFELVYGYGLTENLVKESIRKLEACNDLTKDELDYLMALKLTLGSV